MKVPFFLLTLIAIAISLPQIAAAEATSRDRANILYHKLQHIPIYSSSYRPVESLVIKLVDLDPERAFLYFRFGYSRLARFGMDKRSRLGNRVINRVWQSKLSITKRKRISKRVFQFANPIDGDYWPLHYKKTEQGAAANP